MPNKIIKNGNVVSVRIDDVYTKNEKHLITPYVKPDGTESFFGSFKFNNPEEAKATLRDAVKQLGGEDTIFGGQYPRWETDEYGISLKVGNRVRFFEAVDSIEEVPPLEIRDNIYSIEIQLSKGKDEKTYLRVVRAIKLKAQQPRFNNELYEDSDLPF